MPRLKILERTGPTAIAPAEGDQLAAEIVDLISRGESVELDFTGVDIVATSFLNHAVGSLLGRFQESELAARIHYRGLEPEGVQRLRRVVENARRYYSEPEHAQAVDRALEEVSAGA